MKIYKFSIPKFFYVALCFMYLFSTIVYIKYEAKAADAVTLSVDNVSGAPGSQVAVSVKLSANSNMVAGGFNLEYDSTKVTPVSAAAGSLISGITNNINLSYGTNLIRVNWMGLSAINSAGTLVTVNFSIKSTAAAGSSSLTLKNPLLADINENSIPCTASNGAITIIPPTSSVTLSADNVSGAPGSQVAVNVKISANSNMAAGGFNLEYDPAKVTPVNAAAGSLVSGITNNINLSFATNLIRVNWMGLTPINSAGTIVTINFNIKSDAAAGVSNLILKNALLADLNENSIPCTLSNGSITVTSAQTAALSVDNVRVSPGSQAAVSIKISENSNMVAGGFNLEYDPAKVTPVSAAAGSLISGITNNINLSFATNLIRVNWMGLTPINSAGTIVTIYFNINSGVTSGISNLTLKNVLLADLAENSIPCTSTNGSITITPSRLSIVSTDPANNAVNVPVNKVIKVTFDRDISLLMFADEKTRSRRIVLLDSAENSIPIAYSASGKELSIVPRADLSSNTRYKLIIDNDVICGTDKTKMTNDAELVFTTISQTINTNQVQHKKVINISAK